MNAKDEIKIVDLIELLEEKNISKERFEELVFKLGNVANAVNYINEQKSA